ncbi:hypothetical protein EYF80_007833 [Liparis tanakae]|uniref:Uncharacterized protein n=1 Tax=Liparis tanakae TaxID=230148 RepID=A0A4Z2IVE0_9TELE|nr:hypothetical protein EYF80_007833 [Liparis tanakae]
MNKRRGRSVGPSRKSCYSLMVFELTSEAASNTVERFFWLRSKRVHATEAHNSGSVGKHLLLGSLGAAGHSGPIETRPSTRPYKDRALLALGERRGERHSRPRYGWFEMRRRSREEQVGARFVRLSADLDFCSSPRPERRMMLELYQAWAVQVAVQYPPNQRKPKAKETKSKGNQKQRKPKAKDPAAKSSNHSTCEERITRPAPREPEASMPSCSVTSCAASGNHSPRDKGMVLVLLCFPSLQQAITRVEVSISAGLSSQWSSEDTCEETLLPGAPPPTGASGSCPHVIRALQRYPAGERVEDEGRGKGWPPYAWHWPYIGGHLARQDPGSGYLRKEHNGGRFMDGSLSVPGSLSFITAEQRFQVGT